MVIFAQKTSSSNYYVERHEEECFYAFCTRTAALAAVPKSALVGETVLCNNFFSRGGNGPDYYIGKQNKFGYFYNGMWTTCVIIFTCTICGKNCTLPLKFKTLFRTFLGIRATPKTEGWWTFIEKKRTDNNNILHPFKKPLLWFKGWIITW